MHPETSWFAIGLLQCLLPLFTYTGPAPEATDAPRLVRVKTYTVGIRDPLVVFLGDSKLVAVAGHSKDGAGVVSIWDIAAAKEVKTLKGHDKAIVSAASSPDGKMLATGAKDGQLIVWEVASGKPLKTLEHPEGLGKVDFSPDGKLLASAAKDGQVRLFDAVTYKKVATLNHTPRRLGFGCLRFSSDSKLIASAGYDERIVLWDVATEKELCALKGHSELVTSLAFGKANRYLASASLDNTIRIWDVNSGNEEVVIDAHKHGLWSLAFTKDHRWMISAGSTLIDEKATGEIKVWDTKTNKAVATFESSPGLPISTMALSRDNKVLCTADYDGNLVRWDLRFGK